MSSLGYHIRTHLTDGRVIARNARQRRLVARVVLQHGREAGLHTFSLPDTHLHMATNGCERSASELCRRVEISLTKRLRLDPGFEMYPHIPIRDHGHLTQVVRYILRQHQRHEVMVDPFRESTNLPDLLDMRAIGGEYTRRRLRRLLPRLSPDALLAWWGLPSLAPSHRPLTHVVEAACRAAALPHLDGRSTTTVATRRAAIEVATEHASTATIADLLSQAPRTIQWLRERPAAPVLVRAIQRQLDAEAHLQTTASPSTGAHPA